MPSILHFMCVECKKTEPDQNDKYVIHTSTWICLIHSRTSHHLHAHTNDGNPYTRIAHATVLVDKRIERGSKKKHFMYGLRHHAKREFISVYG